MSGSSDSTTGWIIVVLLLLIGQCSNHAWRIDRLEDRVRSIERK